MGKRYFALEPYKNNEKWLREFYIHLKVINYSNPVIKIRVRWSTFDLR